MRVECQGLRGLRDFVKSVGEGDRPDEVGRGDALCPGEHPAHAHLARHLTHQIVFLNRFDLYHTSPDSGARQGKTRI